jgi:predicted deacylase
MGPEGLSPLPSDSSAYFSADYFAARRAFLDAAARAGAEVRAHRISTGGLRGEELFIDTARLGASSPARLLILTSGVHGVEGHAGSALQQLFLRELADSNRAADVGVLLAHALNPYGFAHGRRVNENNVDLNRNALARFPGPVNSTYRVLNGWLNPSSPPARHGDFWTGALLHTLRLGPKALRQAVAGGQYEFPRGLFYGGREQEESLRIFSDILMAADFGHVETAVHLDLHSGLGKFGRLHLYAEHPAGSAELRRWRETFGAGRVTSAQSSQGGGYAASGVLSDITRRAFAGRTVLAATLEAGTYSATRVLRALREENRAHFSGSASLARTRTDLNEVFCPVDRAWRKALVEQGRALLPRLYALWGR